MKQLQWIKDLIKIELCKKLYLKLKIECLQIEQLLINFNP